MNETLLTAHMQVQRFENVHLKLKRPIADYMFYLTGSKQDWEDVAQEVFIKLWRNWERLWSLDEDRLKNYVFIIVRNYINDEAKRKARPRKNRKRYIEVSTGENGGCYLHDDIVIKEGHQVLQQAVGRLAPEVRLVYQYHKQEYSAVEIAKILKKARSTVYTQLAAAQLSVKTYLSGYFGWNLDAEQNDLMKPASLN